MSDVFDVQEYFAQVQDRLRTCQGDAKIISSLKIEPPNDWERWQLIVWKAKINWEQRGEVLEVLDCWSRRRRKMLMHTFSYHFMKSDGECIFRLDTHGEEIPYHGACHVHIGPERLDHDDSRLHGHSLSEMNFVKLLGLVYKHIKGKKLPWD